MEDRTRVLEPVVAALAAGLVVLVTLLGLIGTAIRDPRPHDIPVGLVGPAPALQQMTTGFDAKAPGTFTFTTYTSEDQARAGIDARDVDAVLVVGAGAPHLIVAGAAGDAVTGVITAVFTGAFAAQGAQLSVEVTHPFAAGDPHGLVLFFLVLATIVSTFVAQVVLFVRGRAARLALWLGVVGGCSVLAGLVGVGMAGWVVGRRGARPADGRLARCGFALDAAWPGCTGPRPLGRRDARGRPLARLECRAPAGGLASAARATRSSPPHARASARRVTTGPRSAASPRRRASTRPWCLIISGPRRASVWPRSNSPSIRRYSFRDCSSQASMGWASAWCPSFWRPGTHRRADRCWR